MLSTNQLTTEYRNHPTWEQLAYIVMVPKRPKEQGKRQTSWFLRVGSTWDEDSVCTERLRNEARTLHCLKCFILSLILKATALSRRGSQRLVANFGIRHG